MKTVDFEKITAVETGVYSIIAHETAWQRGGEYRRCVDLPRPGNGFVLFLAGDAVYMQKNGPTVTAFPGDILYLPAGVCYSLKFNRLPAKTMLINFAMVDVNGEPLRLSDEIFKVAQNAKDTFAEDFAEMSDIYGNIINNKLQLKHRFIGILSALAELRASQVNAVSIDPALGFINNHLKSDINVPMLAKMCALNESTFRREFKKRMGVSCVKYINRERIRKARYVIRHEKMSVGDLSEMLGFYDESRFCKVFKEVTGMTPTQYRRQKGTE